MGNRENRRDTRIPMVAPTSVAMMLPVSYQVLSATGEAVDSEIRTGLALDLSQSGMCLQIRHVPAALRTYLQPGAGKDLRLALDIALPQRRLRLNTRIAWVRPDAETAADAVRVGVEFLEIDDAHRTEVMNFARRLARRPKIQRLVVGSLLLTALAAAVAFWWSQESRERERAELTREIAETEAKLSEKINATEGQYRSVANALDEQTAELNELAGRIRKLGGPGARTRSKGGEDAAGPKAIETIRNSLAGVRQRIQDLEEQILPDGTCVSTDRCGSKKCCTWKNGVCLCDNCCVK